MPLAENLNSKSFMKAAYPTLKTLFSRENHEKSHISHNKNHMGQGEKIPVTKLWLNDY